MQKFIDFVAFCPNKMYFVIFQISSQFLFIHQISKKRISISYFVFLHIISQKTLFTPNIDRLILYSSAAHGHSVSMADALKFNLIYFSLNFTKSVCFRKSSSYCHPLTSFEYSFTFLIIPVFLCTMTKSLSPALFTFHPIFDNISAVLCILSMQHICAFPFAYITCFFLRKKTS